MVYEDGEQYVTDFYQETIPVIHTGNTIEGVPTFPDYYVIVDNTYNFSPSRRPFNRGNDLYFQWVREIDGTAADNNGSTTYNYERIFPILYNSQDYRDLGGLSGRYPRESWEPLIVLGQNPPQLISQQTSSGSAPYSITNTYGYIGQNTVNLEANNSRHLGVKFEFKNLVYEGVAPMYDDDYMSDIYVADQKAYLNPLKLISTTETKDGVTTTTSYTYDTEHYNLISSTTTASNGDQITQRIQYPYHFSGAPYPEMVNRNMVSLPVTVGKYLNDNNSFTTQSQTHYQAFGNQIRPARVEVGNAGFDSYNKAVIHSYDSKGNPIHITQEGKDVVYLWSYNYQHVVAEIRNATLADLGGFNLEQLGALTGTAAITAMVNTLRPGLADALIDSFEYGKFGITRHSDPSGRNTLYEYDGFGRLLWIKDDSGNLVESYEYNYKQ